MLYAFFEEMWKPFLGFSSFIKSRNSSLIQVTGQLFISFPSVYWVSYAAEVNTQQIYYPLFTKSKCLNSQGGKGFCKCILLIFLICKLYMLALCKWKVSLAKRIFFSLCSARYFCYMEHTKDIAPALLHIQCDIAQYRWDNPTTINCWTPHFLPNELLVYYISFLWNIIGFGL